MAGLKSVRSIRKVHEKDPLLWPKCGGQMRIISFIEEHKDIEKIINLFKLTLRQNVPLLPVRNVC